MKSLWAALLLACGMAIDSSGIATAADVAPDAQSNSPLFKRGPLQDIREPVEHIFQFAIENGRLKIDREASEREGREIEKEIASRDFKEETLPPGISADSPDGLRFQAEHLRRKAARLEEKAHELEQLRQYGPTPPAHFVFRKYFSSELEYATPRSDIVTRGIINKQTAEFVSSLSIGHLAAIGHLAVELRTSREGERLSLEEKDGPQWSLNLFAAADGSIRIQVADSQSPEILLQQGIDGKTEVRTTIDGAVTTICADSYVAFCKQYPSLAESRMMPVLAEVGIRPVLPPHSKIVRSAVLAMILRPPKLVADGEQLLDDLDSDEHEVRERATRLLGNLIDQYYDLIQRQLHNNLCSAESRTTKNHRSERTQIQSDAAND